MAIYHLSIKIISRGKGKSAVAAAAYRSAECIKSEYDGRVNDYTLKKGVIHKEILLSENAPSEYQNRAVLWNAVEKSERYKTAQLAREIEVALPKELSKEQNLKLVREYVKSQFVDSGMCADLCIHDTGTDNPHAHIMLTMRPIEQDGKWGAKSQKNNGIKVSTVDWNERYKAEEWREAWANSVNAFLEQNNVAERVDNRSYSRQGIEQIPTIHLGVAASQMERKGIRTDRGNRNREVTDLNTQLRQLKARICKLEDWLKEETANAKSTNFAEIIGNLLSQKQGHYQTINTLKTTAKMVNFLTENHISSVSDLENKVKAMYGKQSELREKLKPVERRLKVLDEHIEQANYYFEFMPVYEKYQSLKPKHQEKFREDNLREITLYEAAKTYLDGVMNGKTSIPRKAWKAEREKLTSERELLNREYFLLKNEVKEVEQIRQSVRDVLESQREKARGKECGLE